MRRAARPPSLTVVPLGLHEELIVLTADGKGGGDATGGAAGSDPTGGGVGLDGGANLRKMVTVPLCGGQRLPSRSWQNHQRRSPIGQRVFSNCSAMIGQRLSKAMHAGLL